MNFGICEFSLVPVRKQPDHHSEMITQLLFGETYTILEEFTGWSLIRISNDNYEGWLEQKQISLISEHEFRHLTSNDHYISTELVQIINNNTRNTISPILLGSNVYDQPNKPFYLNTQEYIFSGSVISSKQDIDRNILIENAFMYKNAPYLWGGKSPFGIDCSGFVQMAYYLSGVKLLRDASQQATQGETINMISDASPGDLCFFENEDGVIVHVGILLPDEKIIHASGCVRTDLIDHQGIYNATTQSYTHQLRLIKKIL